jgi:hypothetical protein
MQLTHKVPFNVLWDFAPHFVTMQVQVLQINEFKDGC